MLNGNSVISGFRSPANASTVSAAAITIFVTQIKLWLHVQFLHAKLHARIAHLTIALRGVATAKIYQLVAFDSVYISAGNDVTNYFRSIANCVSARTLICVRIFVSLFLNSRSTDFEKDISLRNVNSSVCFLENHCFKMSDVVLRTAPPIGELSCFI